MYDDELSEGRRRYFSSGERDGTDAPGVISLIFGCLAVICLLMGFFTCGTTYFAAVPFALLGGLLGFFGRGNMRVAGLLLNFLALVPAVVVMMAVLGVIELTVFGAAKHQGDSETQSLGNGTHTTKRNETDEQHLRQGVQEFDEIVHIPNKGERNHRIKEWMRKYPDLVENFRQNIQEAATEAEKEAEEERKRAQEERNAKDPAEIKRRAEAKKKAEEERNLRLKEEAEAQKVRDKAKAEARAKEAEDAAARKLKFAKSLHSASLKSDITDERESKRLERAYIDTLHEIIDKYSMTKAAKEAKELLEK